MMHPPRKRPSQQYSVRDRISLAIAAAVGALTLVFIWPVLLAAWVSSLLSRRDLATKESAVSPHSFREIPTKT